MALFFFHYAHYRELLENRSGDTLLEQGITGAHHLLLA